MPPIATTHHMPAAPTPDPSSASSASSAVPPPLPPRQRAFTLSCQGHRSPAIAARLGVPERTVRAWIAADLRALAAEQRPTTRQELLQLAITRQLAIAAAAWDAYHQVLSASISSDAASTPDVSVSSVVALSAPGARYLRLAQAAYREIARLQGLYLPAPAEPQEVRIILERLPADEPNLPADGMFPCTSSPATPAESATPTESPAETAIPHPPLCRYAACRASCPPHHDGDDPATTEFAAESATPPAASVSSSVSPVSSVLKGPILPSSAVPAPDLPAETATTPPPPRRGEGAGGAVGTLWPGYGHGQPLPPHLADALGLPRFRERNRRPVRPLFAYRL